MSDQPNPAASHGDEAALVDKQVEEHAEDLGLSLPEDPSEAQQLLLGSLATAQGDAQAYLDDLKRVAADFENYRKRTQREMSENIERASQRVVMGILPVLDSLDLALDHEAESPSEEKLLGGVRSTRDQLLGALTQEGLEVIPTTDEEFDPEVHEAVSMEGAGHALVVTAEMRRGYTLHGRVIRPAMVAVGEDLSAQPEEGAPIGEDIDDG